MNPSRLLMPMPAFLNRTARTTAGIDRITNENDGDQPIGERYCLHRAVRAGRHAQQRAEIAPISTSRRLTHMRRPISSLTGWLSMVRPSRRAHDAAGPSAEARQHRHLVVHVERVERGIDDRGRRRRIPALVTGARVELCRRQHVGHRRRDDDEAREIQQAPQQEPGHSTGSILCQTPSVPDAKRLPHGDQLSDVIAVVIGDEDDAPEVGLLLLAGRHQREQIDRLVLRERLQRLAFALERCNGGVPRCIIGWCRAGGPVVIGPRERVRVPGVHAEVQQVVLGEAQVFDELPCRVLEPWCDRAALIAGNALHCLLEADVRLFPVQDAREVSAKRVCHNAAYYARVSPDGAWTLILAQPRIGSRP